jgi:hypothetical protein
MEIRPTYPIFLEDVIVNRHILFFGLRKNRRGNQEWTIQRHQLSILGTQDTGQRQTKQKHNTEN